MRTILLKISIVIIFISLFFTSCQKSSGVSNIPHIVFTAMQPDSIKSGVDTVVIEFSIVDGDADIGATTTNTVSAIYFEDSRYDTGFFKNPFPIVDPSVELSSKGLQGFCYFYPYPQPRTRTDTVHKKYGDTLTYRIFVTDRANHHSDTITTPRLIIKP